MLGAGGMGEVYRARDVRLRREVALKVLPASLLHDPERRARFEREARVLASLGHPNIAAIHGIEDVTGAAAAQVLVLEFVDGRTLADRIAAGPVPLDEAIPLALQIAEGLEAAHDRGIIHRDLKPANVQITRDGLVKILDFGLAKALDPDESSQQETSHSPTITSASTQLGVILGTAAYMAPEQARGRSVDRRADVWAFGAVLFEMLSGDRAFAGETISDTIAAVLTATPEWQRLPPNTPPAIRALIARCLERDPRHRLQSIGEARITMSRPPDPAAGSTSPRHGVSARLAAAFALTAAVLAGTAAWWTLRDDTTSGLRDLRTFDLALDDILVSQERQPLLSPDGTRMVYSAAGGLWIRSLSDFSAKEVPGTRDSAYPAWSPDGRHLAFVHASRLYRIALDGGQPQMVGSVPGDMTGSGAVVWTVDGNFIVAGSDTVGISEISGTDGSARELLALDRKHESDFHELSLLPDGRSVLFTAHRSQGADTIAVLSNGVRKDVIEIAGDNLRAPVYHAAGYLLFARETIHRGVWAVGFSLDSLQAEGDPFLVDAAGRYPSVARDGTFAIVRGSTRPSDLVWIDRAGSSTPAGTVPGRVAEYTVWPTMRLSPDGQKLAVAFEEELWVSDMTRGVAFPLSRGIPRVNSPTWLPDGSRVLFAGFAGSRAWSVQSVSATETSTSERVLPASIESQWPSAVSPDGKWLLYGQSFARGADLWITPLDRPEDARPLMETPANEREGYFSPDGQWLAYVSDESGRDELYLRRFPIGGDREMLSSGGASSINWSRDSREIFYRGGNAVMSVRLVEANGRLDPSPPRRLFVVPDAALSHSFSASPDGQRFLFARATGSDHVGVILNWSGAGER